jgi:hypothetical protein
MTPKARFEAYLAEAERLECQRRIAARAAELQKLRRDRAYRELTGKAMLKAMAVMGGLFVLGVVLVLRLVWGIRFPWEN